MQPQTKLEQEVQEATELLADVLEYTQKLVDVKWDQEIDSNLTQTLEMLFQTVRLVKQILVIPQSHCLKPHCGIFEIFSKHCFYQCCWPVFQTKAVLYKDKLKSLLTAPVFIISYASQLSSYCEGIYV